MLGEFILVMQILESFADRNAPNITVSDAEAGHFCFVPVILALAAEDSVADLVEFSVCCWRRNKE